MHISIVDCEDCVPNMRFLIVRHCGDMVGTFPLLQSQGRSLLDLRSLPDAQGKNAVPVLKAVAVILRDEGVYDLFAVLPEHLCGYHMPQRGGIIEDVQLLDLVA